MNKNIFWIVAAKIKEGELENLKTLKHEMSEFTKANEPGALNYEWFISPDEKFCHLFENYTDSQAAVLHMNLFLKNYASRFMSVLEIKNFTVYGELTEELIKILTPMNAVKMKSFGGFNR